MPSLAVDDLVGLSQLLAEWRTEGIFPARHALLGLFVLTMTAALHVSVCPKYLAFMLPAFCIAPAYFLGKLWAFVKGKLILLAGVIAIVPSLETDVAYFSHGRHNCDRSYEALRYVHDHQAKRGCHCAGVFFQRSR